MRNTGSIIPLNSQKPSVQLLASVIVILFVSLILLIITLLAGIIIFGEEARDLSMTVATLSQGQRAFVKYSQAMQHMSIFMFPAIAVAWLMNYNIPGSLGLDKRPGLMPVLSVMIIAVILVPLTSFLGEWNSSLTLPEGLTRIEAWLRKEEDEAEILTGWLIYSENAGTLIINILIIAVLPALGEEFFFRSIFQPLFTKLTRSSHLAVIIVAVLFSASHLQFYGFVPRLILGLTYGYLFLWSRSIWLPVCAHFINNLIPVVSAHMIGWENLSMPHENIPGAERWYIILPVILLSMLLYSIRHYYLRTGSQ